MGGPGEPVLRKGPPGRGHDLDQGLETRNTRGVPLGVGAAEAGRPGMWGCVPGAPRPHPWS